MGCRENSFDYLIKAAVSSCHIAIASSACKKLEIVIKLINVYLNIEFSLNPHTQLNTSTVSLHLRDRLCLPPSV